MSQSGHLQPEAIALAALARSGTNKFHRFTGSIFMFEDVVNVESFNRIYQVCTQVFNVLCPKVKSVTCKFLFRCRASCASHYSNSTQALPDLVASYGGFDDTIIDPFGFPLRLDFKIAQCNDDLF